MNLELNIIMLEIVLDLLAVKIVNVEICDCKHSAPWLIAGRQLAILRVKDPVKKREVIGDSLITINMKAALGLND